MTPGHWLFLLVAGPVIAIAGLLAIIREIRREGFLWRTWALRIFFLLVTAGVGFALPEFASKLRDKPVELTPWVSMLASLIIFVLVFSAEVFLGAINISALVFGAMIGVVVAHLAYFLLKLVIDPMMAGETNVSALEQYGIAVKTFLSVVFAYLFVLLIHKNRDRFNFIIPYVEFRRERRGGNTLLVDTSAIIDGRLADLCETQILEGTLIIPRFVLRELQALADSADKHKRSRGRRGLDMLNRLRKNPNISVHMDEGRVPGAQDVDSRLIKLADTLGARILTTDANLTKVAAVQGVPVININHVANAVRPAVLPGESLTLELIRPGEAAGQAVGYMDDGTMIVVEDARQFIGAEVEVFITRLLQTSAGRIIFARLKSDDRDAAVEGR